MATAPQLLPYQPGIVDSARDTIAEGLLSLGLYKDNPYRAYRMAENLSGLMDFIPVIGDVKGGAEAADAFSEGDYATGTGLGLLTALGAIPGAGDVAAGALKSMFVSPARVATFKHTMGDEMGLERAKDLEQIKAPPAEIFEKTAWFRGADGQWRTELPDVGVDFTDDAFYRYHDDGGQKYGMGDELFNLFKHPALQETLPELGHVRLEMTPAGAGDYAGMYYDQAHGLIKHIEDPDSFPAVPKIVMGVDPLDAFGDLREGQRTMIHEIQHAVQDLQGLNRGSNEGIARHQAIDAYDAEHAFLEGEMRHGDKDYDPLDLSWLRRQSADIMTPYKNYRLSAGEQEAFLTDRLLGYTDLDRLEFGLPAGRRGVAPYFTQHVYGGVRNPPEYLLNNPWGEGDLTPSPRLDYNLENIGSRFANQDPTGLLEGVTTPEEAQKVFMKILRSKPISGYGGMYE